MVNTISLLMLFSLTGAPAKQADERPLRAVSATLQITSCCWSGVADSRALLDEAIDKHWRTPGLGVGPALTEVIYDGQRVVVLLGLSAPKATLSYDSRLVGEARIEVSNYGKLLRTRRVGWRHAINSGGTYRTGLNGLNEIHPWESPTWIVDLGPVTDFPANSVIVVKVVGFEPGDVFVPKVKRDERDSYQGETGMGFVRIVPKTKEQRAEALLRVAGELRAPWNYRPVEAEQKLREAVAIDESNGIAWGALGYALDERGRTEEATRAYERAAKFTKNSHMREDYMHRVRKGRPEPEIRPRRQWPSDVPSVEC